MPFQSGFGVYVRFGKLPDNVPLEGPPTMVKASESSPGSEAVRLIATGVSSSVVTDWSSAKGGTFSTVTMQVSEPEDPPSSITVTVIVKTPSSA